jgi:acid phosphatase (class A)
MAPDLRSDCARPRAACANPGDRAGVVPELRPGIPASYLTRQSLPDERALDAPVSERETPRLYLLLRRALPDAGLSTYAAKNHYQRPRPFMVNQLPSCTPAEEAMLRDDGSYPSGHNAIGWAWALILAEIAPDRADAVLARGRAFGQSRVVCNVHWQSDANEGRTMGAAAVARMHAEPEFRADLIAAGAELASACAKGLKSTRDCGAEAAALAPP